MSERPVHPGPRRLADWINPTVAKKVHSLILEAFGERLEERLNQLQEELRTDSYQPNPVKRAKIPKNGKPGEYRVLGVPTVYDRVYQQAILNRLEPVFEPVFDDANFGYRRGRSTKDALRKAGKRSKAVSAGLWMRI